MRSSWSFGPGRAEDGGFVLTEVVASIRRLDQTINLISFNLARADFEQGQSTGTTSGPTWSAASVIGGHLKDNSIGWAILPQTNQAHQLVLGLSAPTTLQVGETLSLELKQNHPDHALGHFRIGVTTNAEALQAPLSFPPRADIAALLLVPAEQRNGKQKEKLSMHFKSAAPETAEARKQIADARKAKEDFEAPITRCLVSATNAQPRTVRGLPRGNFFINTTRNPPPT